MLRTTHLLATLRYSLLVNKTEVTFDIRVKKEASLVILVLIDMDFGICDPGTNIPPIALPVVTKWSHYGSSVTLDGSLSEDYNGTIASYEWTKLSGPASFNINTPAMPQHWSITWFSGCIPLN